MRWPRPVPRPERLELTPEEQALLDEIPPVLPHNDWKAVERSGVASRKLMSSLLKRDAIPETRRRYFTDPNLNIGSKKSRKEAFEASGVTGGEIFESPHFIEGYLRYFIFGPDLPRDCIDGFCKILDEDRGTSGMVRDGLRRFARCESRTLQRESRREASQLGEEFFKLALECGLDDGFAGSIRTAARERRRNNRRRS